MSLFKFDARNFSFDLTELVLSIKTATFAKVATEESTYLNLNLVASQTSPSGQEYPGHLVDVAQVAIKGNRGEVIKVLVHALAEIVGADPIRTRKETQMALSTSEHANQLRYAVNPQYAGMDTAGHCSNCSELAVAAMTPDGDVGSWVHLGPSCGPGEGKFVEGPKFSDPDMNRMAQTLREAGYTVAR